jgi:deoxyribodipyrimidine photo-lyase
MPENSPAIVLFRRDLRLADNPALVHAFERGGPMILLHVRETDDPDAGALGAAQGWWLHHSLSQLGDSIQRLGNRLILRSGNQNAIIEALVDEVSASAVFWNRRYHKKGRDADAELKQRLRERGLEAQSFSANLLHEPSRILTGSGGPYRVYTPFWKAFSRQEHLPEPLAAPTSLPSPEIRLGSDTLADWKLLPTSPDWAAGFLDHWQPGEAGAAQALQAFVEEALDGYKLKRDLPGVRFTSRLSPHLALGEISPLQIWQAIREAASDAPDEDILHFRKELVWREFSWHLLFHYPNLADEEFNSRFADFGWDMDQAAFDAWTKGMTGYPIVDAGMRELWQTGWMHNRVRMIVASFLIKDLMIDWRHGERWFRDTLVDADPASNAASWQWVAGSGADAAPYFRVFNPLLQGEKFDPDGTYIRRFIPELAKLPNAYIHKPMAAPALLLQAAGVKPGVTYPEPIIDHGFARDRALAAYRETGSSAD